MIWRSSDAVTVRPSPAHLSRASVALRLGNRSRKIRLRRFASEAAVSSSTAKTSLVGGPEDKGRELSSKANGEVRRLGVLRILEQHRRSRAAKREAVAMSLIERGAPTRVVPRAGFYCEGRSSRHPVHASPI